MLHYTRIEHCPVERAPSSSRRWLSKLGVGWRDYQRRRRLRATEHLLHGLNDRTLKDIGLHRSEIHAAVRGDPHAQRGGPVHPHISRYY